MRKHIILAALPLAILAVSCNNATIDEKIAQYNAAVEQQYDQAQQQLDAILANDTLTAEQKDAQAEVQADEVYAKIKTMAIKTIRRNGGNALGLAALKDVSYLLDAAEIEKVLPYMKGENANSKVVESLRRVIETAEGKMFTDFEVDGVKFSEFVGNGKYVLVDFWASWCGPCKQEIPNIAKVYSTYAGENFDVLSIAVWDEPQNTAVAAAEHGVVWNQIVNAQRIPTDLYGIMGIPQIMLFGPDGTILKRDLRGSAIEEAVREALGR